MFNSKKTITIAGLLAFAALTSLGAHFAHAADTKSKSATPVGPVNSPSATDDSLSGAERVNVENIKEKYWARGDESELGVVQNRLYTKEHKFELGVFGGTAVSDPFLSVKSLGGLAGYHFSEYFSLNVMGFKEFVGPSSALELLQLPSGSGGLGTTANTNEPRWFLGSEVAASFLYGKLSLIGKAIIHYDMHVLGGVGVTSTESGKYFTPYVGIGQQIYLSKWISLRLDYRLMEYSETILEKVRPSLIGQSVGTRANYTNSIVLGLNFLINPFGKKIPADDTDASNSGGVKK
jgi:outer membrane beta-barrel protein